MRLPSFYILKDPLTRGQVAKLLGESETPEHANQPMTGLTINEIESLQATIQTAFDSKNEKQSLEVRLPSFPCLLYTSPSPRDRQKSRMPSSA